MTDIEKRRETAMTNDGPRTRDEIMRAAFGSELTQEELEFFGETCRRTGLDPFAKQIYAIKRKQSGRDVMTIQTSIDGFRALALRSGNYRGQRPIEWCGPDGEWKRVWLEREPPRAAKVEILCGIFTEPLVSVALWDECVQTKYNGEVTHMWKVRGPTMLAKCAEAAGLRRAFPQELSGVYSGDEMPEPTQEDVEVEWAEPERLALPPAEPLPSITAQQLEEATGLMRDLGVKTAGEARKMVADMIGEQQGLSALSEANATRMLAALHEKVAGHYVSAQQIQQLERAMNRLRVPSDAWNGRIWLEVCEAELMGRNNDDKGEPININGVTDAACGPLLAHLMALPIPPLDEEAEDA